MTAANNGQSPATCLLIVFAAWAFILLMLTAFHQQLSTPVVIHFDQQTMQAVHQHQSVVLTRLMLGLTWIGSFKVFASAAAVIAVLLALRRKWHDALVIAIAIIGASALNNFLKIHFRRPRPRVPWALAHEHSYSFPSGHAVYAVVLYGVLSYIVLRAVRPAWPRIGIVAAAATVVLGIGVSRIYLGAHYPTDVAAGYLAGSGWLLAVIWSDRKLRQS